MRGKLWLMTQDMIGFLRNGLFYTAKTNTLVIFIIMFCMYSQLFISLSVSYDFLICRRISSVNSISLSVRASVTENKKSVQSLWCTKATLQNLSYFYVGNFEQLSKNFQI